MATTPYSEWHRGGSPATLSAAVFAGELVLIRGEPTVARIVEHVRGRLQAFFGSGDPQAAEARMEPEVYRRTVTKARRLMAEDDTLADLWAACLSALGYEAADMFQDRLRLRIVPSAAASQTRFIRPLPVHRDSWGARIHAQINWWLPVFPLAASRTMVLWPDRFRTPVANTSSDWDYDALVEKRVANYPLLPEALSDPPRDPVPILIEPGTLLAFSAAHLHGSASDASGLARFSLDTRTVWADDLRAGRGAPNVDCARKPPLWRLFTPSPDDALSDLAHSLDNPAIGGSK